MPAIWRSSDGDWSPLVPSEFPDEATLHTLVEDAPNILPLAGSPRLTVLGREVTLGNGSADLVAVEASGRLCIIEAKLAKNPDARRAVVAQVLTYAASLRGIEPSVLEKETFKNIFASEASRQLKKPSGPRTRTPPSTQLCFERDWRKVSRPASYGW